MGGRDAGSGRPERIEKWRARPGLAANLNQLFSIADARGTPRFAKMGKDHSQACRLICQTGCGIRRRPSGTHLACAIMMEDGSQVSRPNRWAAGRCAPKVTHMRSFAACVVCRGLVASSVVGPISDRYRERARLRHEPTGATGGHEKPERRKRSAYGSGEPHDTFKHFEIRSTVHCEHVPTFSDTGAFPVPRSDFAVSTERAGMVAG